MKPDTTLKREEHKATIDWNEVHRRIENVRKVLERDWAPPPEKKREILRTRAKALARQEKEKDIPRDHIEIVQFLLANETYGIESIFVQETYPLRDLTPIPGTPPFVLGIINVRGRIVSILDIRKFFDLPEKGLTDLNKVLILNGHNMEFGLLADAVLGVRKIRANELQASLPTLTGIREQYLKGVTKERFVILDAEKLLADKKIIVHDNIQG
ncbi:MAG TPA: chemotaxis protein CheW [Bacteroidetes bacterium]|nr:chemotaxis protein CheW [Bacteroidota bacterium]